ncbi:MAG: LuxR C-terminal-related transcriptional regulator [Acidimicrobiales bacterium]
MKPIAVGLFDEQEIFRRGAVACVADDPVLDVVSDGPTPPRADALAGIDLDVAVVSPAVARAGTFGCPMVVCGATDTIRTIGTVPGVSAVFLRTELRPAQLVSAIRAAAVGLQIQSLGPSAHALDLRSRRVLELLAEGAATREISDTLGYSERTIKSVIGDLERSLGARSRAHAVALALREHLI